jgi:hypothetical protein
MIEDSDWVVDDLDKGIREYTRVPTSVTLTWEVAVEGMIEDSGQEGKIDWVAGPPFRVLNPHASGLASTGALHLEALMDESPPDQLFSDVLYERINEF